MPSTPGHGPRKTPNKDGTDSSSDSRPSTSGSRPSTSSNAQSPLSRRASSKNERNMPSAGSPRMSSSSRVTGSPRVSGSPRRSARGSRIQVSSSSRRKETPRNFEEDSSRDPTVSEMSLISEIPLLSEKPERGGEALWTKARGMKAGIRIVAGKAKVSELIHSLRGKLSDVKEMLSDLDDQKGKAELPGAVPTSLPRFDMEDGAFEDSSSLHRKNETLYVGERFKFCYNPIDEHERYLPAVGVRSVKSYRGVLCELLGNPANREERAAWQRRLRIESAMEANGTAPPAERSPDASLRRLRSAAATPRLPLPLSPRSRAPLASASPERGVPFPSPAPDRSFDREVKRLHALRALASHSRRNVTDQDPPAS